MIEYLFIDKSLEEELIDEVRVGSDYYDIVKSNDRVFIYGVDCDNDESSTGIMEFVSIGANAPKELISFL